MNANQTSNISRSDFVLVGTGAIGKRARKITHANSDFISGRVLLLHFLKSSFKPTYAYWIPIEHQGIRTMNIKKIPMSAISMADILSFASAGDKVESSRTHVGPTTASLSHFHACQGTQVTSLLADTTFADRDFCPHQSVSLSGRFDVGSHEFMSCFMKAHTADVPHCLHAGDNVADWHMERLKRVFPQARIVAHSVTLRENASMITRIIEAGFDLLSSNPAHCFRHYVESDGRVTRRENVAGESAKVLADLAFVTGDSGWKIPNVLNIVMDILLGSEKGRSYYHLCGPAMWKYIDQHDYLPIIAAILERMKCFGREMYLVNTGSFKIFSFQENRQALDEVWILFRKLSQETSAKRKTSLEKELAEKIRTRKLPWYDKCEGKSEITQHDLKSFDQLYVPAWAMHASFEELSEFVAYTVKVWKGRKR